MTILSWKLSVAPTQTPDSWLLLVDGFACTTLITQAPYVGPGAYSIDLAQMDPAVSMPTDSAAHNYSVALMGQGTIGPPSVPISIRLPPIGRPPSLPVVWPAADTLAST